MTAHAVLPLTRRRLLATTLLAPAVLAGCRSIGAERTAGAAVRPNLLLLLADDWSWPHAGILGDPVVKTPVFDRMAREGVLFRNAFVSAPSCTPSRGSILTGEYHWRLGHAVNLGGSLPPQKVTYPEMLQSAGYHVGRAGKGFWPTKNLGRATPPAGKRYRNFHDFMQARPAGQPFCFWFGGKDPHRPYPLHAGVESGLAPNRVRVPPPLPDVPVVRSDLCDYYWAVQRFDRECGDILAYLERTGELDRTLIVMTSDNGMPFPRHKATLYDGGVRVPLAIRWGDRLRGGRIVTDFVSLCDIAPTFLEAAGLRPAAEMTGRSLTPILASNKTGRVDAGRAFVLVGMERHCTAYPCRAIRTDAFLYIRNYHPETWDPGPVDFEFNYNSDPSPTKTYMMEHRSDPAVKDLYYAAFGKRPEEELYDLKKDPHQLTNVADDPHYADIKAALARQLEEQLRATRDPRILGDTSPFNTWR